MNWFTAVFTGLLTAVLGAFAVGWLSDRYWTQWLRVSSREGQAGYVVILHGLIGAVVGLVVGVIASRWLGGGPGLGFLKGLGGGVSAVVVLAGVVTGLVWLWADFEPTVGGRPVMLQCEIEAAPSFVWPDPVDGHLHSANIIFDGVRSGGSTQLTKRSVQRKADGSAMVQVEIRVLTSYYQKQFRLDLGTAGDFRYDLPVPSRPPKDGSPWTDWLPVRDHYRDGKWTKPPGATVPRVRFRTVIGSEKNGA